jgi:hypothetical protein
LVAASSPAWPVGAPPGLPCCDWLELLFEAVEESLFESLLFVPELLDCELVPGIPVRAFGDDAVLLGVAVLGDWEPGGRCDGACEAPLELDEPGIDDEDEGDELEELDELEDDELDEELELDELVCEVGDEVLELVAMLMHPFRTSTAPASKPGISNVVFMAVPPGAVCPRRRSAAGTGAGALRPLRCFPTKAVSVACMRTDTSGRSDTVRALAATRKKRPVPAHAERCGAAS